VVFLVLLLCSFMPTTSWAQSITLEPIVTGLDSPVYVTHAQDNTSRLFILERPGRIHILQPGTIQPTLFLDISQRVLSGGEQGLLGLAFHPQFMLNGRFFVNYTRLPDGATVIAEYRVSAADSNSAVPTETAFLAIDQPFSNHNGGMIGFGPDGFLYIGVGDGGSGNDPGNRAQDTQELLGKLLRIDVDQPQSTAVPYSIPIDNPFFVSADPNDSGRDEIFAVGLRNPWRFSFDRATDDLYVGDVGQNAREEVHIVTHGGNYGWRVLEGTRCTGLGPGSCDDPSFIPPVAEYAHAQGRCSVTGGYVYRGSAHSLPLGAYIYGDFCTGEIFILQGGEARVLLDTDLLLSSFGEDEAGELYVVDLGGTVFRVTNADASSNAQAFLLEVDNPLPEQIVFGVALLNGWAFATDEGISIESIRLFIDGVGVGRFLCCAPRADVEAVFPEFPADNTFRSGWTGLFNWAVLSAGPHTVRVAASSTTGAVFSSPTHIVHVVKLGDGEFLDFMDFSNTTFDHDGTDIIARQVIIRFTGNPRSRVVSIRMRWLPSAQKLVVVESLGD
jgi:glucose/arabinose dehydrogenase